MDQYIESFHRTYIQTPSRNSSNPHAILHNRQIDDRRFHLQFTLATKRTPKRNIYGLELGYSIGRRFSHNGFFQAQLVRVDALAPQHVVLFHDTLFYQNILITVT